MTDYNAVIVEALCTRLGLLIEDKADNPCTYVKGDWQGDIHRKRMARRIVALRGALRQVRWEVRRAA